ncbi:MAG: 2-C-methyl-D-erythritol 4-phosphate cytidylyltransferase [Mangrovibacterium sp.]
MKKFALIVAGGSGSRMNMDIPKQFLDLAGKPVLMRTMERFAAFDPQIRFIVVLPAGYMTYWNDLCREHRFGLKHKLIAGGLSRFQSVKNGLAELPEEGLVFIHDGVRPLVSLQTIRNCADLAMKKGNAIPAMPVTESLRRVTEQGTVHVERSGFFLVQTPQTFLISVIKKAYLQSERDNFTDDASVCEAMGEKIYLVEGNAENIKLTRPLDLQIAEYLFRQECVIR